MKSPSPPELDIRGLELLRNVSGYDVKIEGDTVEITFVTDVKGEEKTIRIRGTVDGNKVKLNEAQVINGEVRNMSLDELKLWVEYINEVSETWSTY